MQSESQETPVYRMGNPHPVNPDLVFLRYKDGKEVWVSVEKMAVIRKQRHTADAKQRAKPENKIKAKAYALEYGRLPKRKAKQSAYYKQPEVRARVRQKWATDPEMRRKQKARSQTVEAAIARREYREANKDILKMKLRNYRQSRKADPMVRLVKNCRSRIADAVRSSGTHKLSKSVILLGCSFDYFRKWIEAKWKRGMSWMNYGHFWHIDHILPVVSFDLTSIAGQLQCFRFTNTQPLWKDENLSKGAKLFHLHASPV